MFNCCLYWSHYFIFRNHWPAILKLFAPTPCTIAHFVSVPICADNLLSMHGQSLNCFFFVHFGHSIEFDFESFLMLAQRIVSLWKFIGLFPFSWLWIFSPDTYTVHFAFSTSLVSGKQTTDCSGNSKEKICAHTHTSAER